MKSTASAVSGDDITALLSRYRAGDQSAFEELITLVYDELRQLARYQLRNAGAQTLSPTGLVNELFVRLKQSRPFEAQDRKVFFAAAAKCMRHLLIDIARKRKSAKRGGGGVHVALDEKIHGASDAMPELDNLVEAIERLSRMDEKLARVVELRYLVGLTIEETAGVLGVSATTVKNDWLTAKAWLARELLR